MIKSREQLIFLLNEAAELEHLLTVQYLYAAFSTKRLPEEGLAPELQNVVDDWGQLIILIARQEMEHLGLVNNILTSIGGMPYFYRPNLPQSGKYFPCPMHLEVLNKHSIKRFVCFERPEHITEKDAFCLEFGEHKRFSGDPNNSMHYTTISELYAKIKEGILKIPLSEEELFIGPPNAQVGGAELDLTFNRVGAEGGVYDVTLFPVINRATAVQAIDLITEQGEGSLVDESHTEPSHYERFLEIKKELERLEKEHPGFNPARDVVKDPILWNSKSKMKGNKITHPLTREVMALFNNAYELMLMMLLRFYAHTDETEAELNTLKYATFFPFMSMVIRPVGELLTTMPAYKDKEFPKAGASFEISSTIQFLPHKAAAWTIFHQRLVYLSEEMDKLSKKRAVPDRLGYVGKNIGFIAEKLKKQLV